MLLYNILLILHFLAFASYIFTLAAIWPTATTAIRDKKGLVLGILILLTGIALVALKYPQVNYYKVIPKLFIFLVITIINIRFGDKPFTRVAYYSLIILTLLASCIAVARM